MVEWTRDDGSFERLRIVGHRGSTINRSCSELGARWKYMMTPDHLVARKARRRMRQDISLVCFTAASATSVILSLLLQCEHTSTTILPDSGPKILRFSRYSRHGSPHHVDRTYTAASKMGSRTQQPPTISIQECKQPTRPARLPLLQSCL